MQYEVKKIKLNPIRVLDNQNLAVRLVEPTYLFTQGTVRQVEVRTQAGAIVHTFEVTNTLLISLDELLEVVELRYFDATGEIGREELILIDKVALESGLSPEERSYEALKLYIKNIMDMPDGTEIEVSKHTELLKQATTDVNARVYVSAKIKKELMNKGVDSHLVDDLTYRLYAELYGMGALQELDDDESIGEIMVNARTFPRFVCDIYYIKNQVKYKYDKTFKTLPEMENVFRKVVEFSKRELNASDNAMVEATRPNKDRVNVIIPEASENYLLNIRKFSNFLPNMEMMRKSGTIDDFNDRLFQVLVRGMANIGIGGYMGTGKTTLINFLLTYTDPMSRKVVVASISETDIDRVLKGHDVAILNVDDERGFSFEKHLKFALRSTADRIVVPESRGEEFKQIYEANLKTSGNLFTAHALDDDAFMDMCVEMYKSSPSAQSERAEYVKDKLAKSMDIVVIMRKVGGKIRIKSISEVIVKDGKFVGLHPLQEWDFSPENPLEGEYKRTSYRLSAALKRKLNENGIPMSEMEGL